MSERSDNYNALEHVEIKLSYLENFVLELQSVVLEQGKIIDKLVEENKRMKEKVAEMASQLEGDIPNVRPPHY
ncbi:MAG: SlyX family protein [Candidatus Treponema excrementipullorum]|nr:SlyX family protein [Spirochaetia bacterium]MDD7012887.1 SlyX family protein [Candidatus Treponema excrementipullorum]MDY4707203.1 SlyX family protein [Candidatus Treponema excrementipullorum]